MLVSIYNLHATCLQSLAGEKLTVHNAKDILIIKGKNLMAKSVANNYLLPKRM